MRYVFCLVAMVMSALVLQCAILPGMVPPSLQPDVGMLLAITMLAFAPREFGLIGVFVMGMQADLFGSSRFGLLTLCYMLAAGVMLCAAWRELTRGDLVAAWFGGVIGTAIAHGMYMLLAGLLGDAASLPSMNQIMWLVLAAAVWGLPLVWISGQWLQITGTLERNVSEKWSREARMSAARRGKFA